MTNAELKLKKIKLSSGNYALVDDEYYEFLNRYKWNESKSVNTSYAITTMYFKKKPTAVSMHRLLMNMKLKHVDHINRNGLDNRVKNLRLCDPSLNQANSNQQNKNRAKARGLKINQIIIDGILESE